MGPYLQLVGAYLVPSLKEHTSVAAVFCVFVHCWVQEKLSKQSFDWLLGEVKQKFM